MNRVAAGVGLVCFILALPGVWARSTYGAPVSVDEPQYLLSALSIANDGDLDVSDEIANDEFRSFHPPDLNTQTTPLDETGRQVSPHDPLLPIVLAPAVAVGDQIEGIGSHIGARLLTAVIAAACAAMTYLVAVRRFAVGVPVAAMTVVAFFGAGPLAPYATQIYPEMTAALCVVLGVGLVTSDDRRGRGADLALAGIVLVVTALPWFAVKYAPVAAAIAAVALWQLMRSGQRRHALWGAAILTFSGVIYLAAHQRIYGGWTVYSAGDHFVDDGEFSVVGLSPDYLGRTERLINLLIDRRFGLIPWMPAWLLAPTAVLWFGRTSPLFRRALPALAAGYLTATYVALTMHGWWSPGRQLVVVLPIAVIAVAALADAYRPARYMVAAGGVMGIANWLWLALESNRGVRTIIVDFWETAAWPYRLVAPAFPDVVRDGNPIGLQLAWLVVLLGLSAVGWRLGSPRSDARPADVATPPVAQVRS